LKKAKKEADKKSQDMGGVPNQAVTERPSKRQEMGAVTPQKVTLEEDQAFRSMLSKSSSIKLKVKQDASRSPKT
jgi:hypothetical protein